VIYVRDYITWKTIIKYIQTLESGGTKTRVRGNQQI